MAIEAARTSTLSNDSVLSGFRWVILGLVVIATALNYVDRQIIAILKPVLSEEFGWTARDYAHIVSAFQFAAAAGYVVAGWFVDRLGVRWAYATAVIAWSCTAMAHALARSLQQFVFLRVVLGPTEAVNTPAAVKTIATIFPMKERSVALGIMNSGANIGAIITPLIVPALALAVGWQAAFAITGAAGLVWAAFWLVIYRQRKGAQPAPAEKLVPSAPAESVPWSVILRDRRTWAVAGGKLLSDPVWWFLLFWLPDFMGRTFGLDMKTFGPPVAAIYTMAAFGALAGGGFAAYLLKRGVSLNAARKTTLLLSALIVLPIPLALIVKEYWHAVFIVGLALAAHQAYSTNLFALAADVFPQNQLGRVIGLGALFGNIGGLIILEVTGWLLDRTGQYWPIFAFCAVTYLAGVLLVQVLIPRIKAAKEDALSTPEPG